MRIIELPCYGIVIELFGDGSGAIYDELREDNPYNDPEVNTWNDFVDGITSLILGHACAGIDVEDPKYIEGIETSVQACSNMT